VPPKPDAFAVRQAGAGRCAGALPWARLGILANLCVLAAAPSVANAQKVLVETGVGSQLLWTSNAGFGQDGDVGSGEDTILQVSPRISIRADGARLKLAGSAALNAVAYANHTHDSRILPEVDASARLEAIERLGFLEAGYRATQTSQNPFGVREEGASTSNVVTTTQARFSPVIESSTRADFRYRLRSDNNWTRVIGANSGSGVSTAAGYFGRHAALVEQDPRPFGWRLEADRSVTRYDDSAQPDVRIDTARAGLRYALNEEFSVGLRGGVERNNFDGVDGSRTISGVDLRWRPSERTLLTAQRERRFFGSGWEAAFDHRMPQLAWSFKVSRGVDTTPQSLFELPATANVAALLDAMFTTRFPDPAERARAVQDFIAHQSLPSATIQPTVLLSERLSLVTLRNASVALTGTRNTLALSAYQVRTEDVPGVGLFAGGGANNNNMQYGAAANLSHRLTPALGLNLGVSWSRTRALESIGPDRTAQRGVTVQFNLEASRSTSAYFGGRLRKIDSNVVTEGKEGAVFAGMDHRF